MEINKFDRFNKLESLKISTLAILFVLWHWLAIGWRVEHCFFLASYLILFYAVPITRKLIKSFLFLLLYVIAYDSLRIIPNYTVNPVHIQDLYEYEKFIFGVNISDTRLTLNELFTIHNSGWLDVYTGFSYLMWVPAPIALGVYMFFQNKKLLVEMWSFFLFVNLIGFTGYYLFPAAPPWYVAEHGFELDFSTMGSAAGLLRFDEFCNIHFFRNMYEKNANVFAAVPSLHCAYPAVAMYYAFKNKMKIMKWLMTLLTISICFSAIYTSHHYMIDVLLGLSCVGLAAIIYEKLLLPRGFNKWLDNYASYIESK